MLSRKRSIGGQRSGVQIVKEVQIVQYLRRMEPATKDSASPFPRREKEGHVRKVRTQCVQWSIPAPPPPSLPSTFPKPPLETPVVG